MQETIPYPGNFPEWIPYEEFDDVQDKTQGAFGAIKTAVWKRGRVKGLAAGTSFSRAGPERVVLKQLLNLKTADEKYMSEVSDAKCQYSNRFALTSL